MLAIFFWRYILQILDFVIPLISINMIDFVTRWSDADKFASDGDVNLDTHPLVVVNDNDAHVSVFPLGYDTKVSGSRITTASGSHDSPLIADGVCAVVNYRPPFAFNHASIIAVHCHLHEKQPPRKEPGVTQVALGKAADIETKWFLHDTCGEFYRSSQTAQNRLTGLNGVTNYLRRGPGLDLIRFRQPFLTR